MTERTHWLVIDATNLVYRLAYGVGLDHTAATLTKRFNALNEQLRPALIAAAFDCGASFRSRILPSYKAGRKKLEGIDEAIAEAKVVCHTAGVGVIEVPDFEADDIVATITAIARGRGHRVVVYSSDKDLYQTIDEGHVTQLVGAKSNGKGGLQCEWVTARSLRESHAVDPCQWVDYRCLVGDKSDNITGVRSIGDASAASILKACGSLKGFYASPFAAPITNKQRNALLAARGYVEQIRGVVQLRRDVPLPELWEEGC